MKPTTIVWVAAQNIGYPDESEQVEGNILEVSKFMAGFLLNATMGKGIKFSINRTEALALAGLSSKQASQSAIDREIEAMFDPAFFEDSPNNTHPTESINQQTGLRLKLHGDSLPADES